jgi:hypothetical protein
MKVFSTLDAKDYTVDDIYASAPMSWELRSGSNGINITSPDDLYGAITVGRATNDPVDFYESNFPKINEDSGVYEYILYSSIKHLFYDRGNFYSGSVLVTSSLAGLPNNSYVFSIGQDFYGERVKPGSFEVSTQIADRVIRDDSRGNLYYTSASVNIYVGNIFYNTGIAIIKHNTGSVNTSITSRGLKIVSGTNLYVDYSSDVRLHRHQVNVKLRPMDFNFSPFNPSILSTYTATTGSVTQSFNNMNIKPSSGSSTWNLYNLMRAGVIKPYITTIGLYNDKYELLAVAKTSEPIQRTFDVNQIFIVRFDT